jgi:hypothetical protein
MLNCNSVWGSKFGHAWLRFVRHSNNRVQFSPLFMYVRNSAMMMMMMIMGLIDYGYRLSMTHTVVDLSKTEWLSRVLNVRVYLIPISKCYVVTRTYCASTEDGCSPILLTSHVGYLYCLSAALCRHLDFVRQNSSEFSTNRSPIQGVKPCGFIISELILNWKNKKPPW